MGGAKTKNNEIKNKSGAGKMSSQKIECRHMVTSMTNNPGLPLLALAGAVTADYQRPGSGL